MNNTFNLKRFGLLFKKHSLEHVKTYLLSTAVLTGIISLTLGFFTYANDGRLALPIQAIMFIYIIAGAGSIFTSLSFTELGNKRKATSMLTLPASHLEKFLVSWIYSYIIFQLICVGVFYLVDSVIINIAVPPAGSPNTLINIFDTEQLAFEGFIVFALLHAFTLWGSIFFEKMHFIKTAFVIFIYFIALIIINNQLLHLITGKSYLSGMAFQQLNFKEDNHYWRLLPTNSMNSASLIVLALTIIILWLSAFYRLKEKEI